MNNRSLVYAVQGLKDMVEDIMYLTQLPRLCSLGEQQSCMNTIVLVVGYRGAMDACPLHVTSTQGAVLVAEEY